MSARHERSAPQLRVVRTLAESCPSCKQPNALEVVEEVGRERDGAGNRLTFLVCGLCGQREQ